MKKYIFILLLSVWVPKGLLAQNKHLDISGTLSGMYIAQYKTFEDFRTTYNQPGSNLLTPLKPLNFAPGFNVQMQDRVGILWLGAGFQYFGMATSAGLTMNEKRDMSITWNEGYAEIGFGKSWGNNFIYAVGAFAGGGMTMESYYTYRDGVVSYGNENPYNGVFHAITIQPFFGIKSGWGLNEHLGLAVNLLFHPAMGLQENLQDNNVGKTLSINTKGRYDLQIDNMFTGVELAVGLKYTLITY